MSSLSPRENQVCAALAAGMQNKEIAHTLEISHATVDTHLRRIYQKLGVHSRTQALMKFITAGSKCA